MSEAVRRIALETVACPLTVRDRLKCADYEAGAEARLRACPGRLGYREGYPQYNTSPRYTCTSCRRVFSIEEARRLAALRGHELITPGASR